MTLNNFLFYTIFGGQNAILVFQTTCMWDKKCCGLVRDKNISFCHVPCLQFVMYLKMFYKSNTGQLELFCPVLHFLANQTHPYKNCLGHIFILFLVAGLSTILISQLDVFASSETPSSVGARKKKLVDHQNQL